MKSEEKDTQITIQPTHPEAQKMRGFLRGLVLMFLDSAFVVLVGFAFLYQVFPTDLVWPMLVLSLALTLILRVILSVYRQVWRFGGIESYIRLILADVASCAVFSLLCALFFRDDKIYAFGNPLLVLAFYAVVLVVSLAVRMVYRYIYKRYQHGGRMSKFYGKILRWIGSLKEDVEPSEKKIRLAIRGAGVTGVTLASNLYANIYSQYAPAVFIDSDKSKIGKRIQGIPVLSPETANVAYLLKNHIFDVVLTAPEMSEEEKGKLVMDYRASGLRVHVYDAPTIAEEGKAPILREVRPEEMLFREPLLVLNDKDGSYYRDKVILITGAGGSIGSELCRQVAKKSPKLLVLLDICENGIYDIQQELRLDYGNQLNTKAVIVSVTNKKGTEQVFKAYQPEVVLHAAAHKHVPLMEDCPVEAVYNNVFGTRNVVELCIQYQVKHFIMVSTDKAVNPTNVMGATKRLCEMIVFANGATEEAKKNGSLFSATRFGNVLGSAGSVVPLFKKQIARGGPVTVTDKRIIRYFMTIPEAAQLVLDAGSMAKAQQLFVLDMGEPVSILSMAEKLITFSGKRPYVDIDIVETGLRPGEKLYEELLVNPKEMNKTNNNLIFVEEEKACDWGELCAQLNELWTYVEAEDAQGIRACMKRIVPTFKDPDEVNKQVK